MLSAKKVFLSVSVGVALALILLPVPAVAQTGRVNLSIATADQVAKVPGVTPQLAKAIVDYKAANGLAKATDLMKVPGMTPEIFSKITPALDKDGNVLIGAPAKKDGGDDEEEAVLRKY
jgi:DNA uptake protein ComE-like DNA-binding protein